MIVGADYFSAAAQKVVDYLNANTPLPDWSVSRVAGGEQVHIHVHHNTILDVGNRIDWNESFCSRMAAGAANVVPNARLDPDYNDLAAADDVGAYAGFPITDDEGAMFGVLCGVRPAPLGIDEPVDRDLLKLMSELLSSQLVLARSIDRERRGLEIAEALAHTDALTGLLNRRGWDLIALDAQQRIDAFGDPVAVAVIDLDGLKTVNDVLGHDAGDDLLRRAARAITMAGKPGDRIARYGGDEFTVLANNVAAGDLGDYFAAFSLSLEQHGVSASLGYAGTNPGTMSVADAFSAADQTMYIQKRSRKLS